MFLEIDSYLLIIIFSSDKYVASFYFDGSDIFFLLLLESAIYYWNFIHVCDSYVRFLFVAKYLKSPVSLLKAKLSYLRIIYFQCSFRMLCLKWWTKYLKHHSIGIRNSSNLRIFHTNHEDRHDTWRFTPSDNDLFKYLLYYSCQS